MVWNRNANIEMAKLKYGMNVSNTYTGIGANDRRDVEITGKLLPGLDVFDIKEDEFTKVLTPEKTGKKVIKYQDDETDVWF